MDTTHLNLASNVDSELPAPVREYLHHVLEEHLEALVQGPLSHHPRKYADDHRRRARFYDAYIKKPFDRLQWSSRADDVRKLAGFLDFDLSLPDSRLAEAIWDEASKEPVVSAEHSWSELLTSFDDEIALRDAQDKLRDDKNKLLQQTQTISDRLRAATPKAKAP